MGSRLDKFLRVLPLINLFLSLSALLFAAYIHFETTRPHTRFEEALDKLGLLERAIHDAEEGLQALEKLRPNASRYWPYIYQAKRLHTEARSKLIEGDYEEAERLIREALVLLNEIPRISPPVPPAPPAWLVVAATIMIVILTAIIVIRTRTKEHKVSD